MTDKQVTVLARISAKAGMADTVKQEILALIEPTRAEPGCINYDLHQSSSDPCLFMLYENWKSIKDLEEHLEMPYLMAFKGKADRLLAAPLDITLWDMRSKPAQA
jgi:quinol monooxygenase YgiN